MNCQESRDFAVRTLPGRVMVSDNSSAKDDASCLKVSFESGIHGRHAIEDVSHPPVGSAD